MFANLNRKSNCRIALSQQESFARRNTAVYALGDPPAHPDSIAALYQIARGPDDLNIRRSATSRLANLSSPESLRALLDLMILQSSSSNWIFTDACSGLMWNTITLRKIESDAVKALLQTGRNVLAWPRETAGERAVQALFLRDIGKIFGNLDTAASRSARANLNDVLQGRRASELPRLTKTASESKAFEEAESAIKEIAELGTAQARAALVEVRAQPERTLEHFYEGEDTSVTHTYATKWVTVARRSSELGESLEGNARALWDAAKAVR